MRAINCRQAIAMALGILTIGASDPGSAVAQPERFSYQARLTDSGGLPLSGSHTLFISLYRGGSAGSANSGTLIFKESVTLTVTDGIVSHSVGTGSNISGGPPDRDMLFTSSDVFLQVAVDVDLAANVVLPRTRLDSVPYALVSADGEKRIPITGTPPISITAPGSYYLTGNLTAPVGTSAIIITNSQANGVKVDLNGYSIIGPGPMAGGSSPAVVLIAAYRNVRLCNGVIRDFASGGIAAAGSSGVIIEDLTVTNCRLSGIVVGTSCTVTRCHTRANHSQGIETGDNCVVTECHSAGNRSYGIHTGTGCIVQNCVADGNQDIGFFLGSNCNVDRCIARRNASRGIQLGSSIVTNCDVGKNLDHGISLSSSCYVSGCRIYDNIGNGIYCPNTGGTVVENCVSTSNTASGIDVQEASLVINCTSRLNGRSGISLGRSSTARNCEVTENGLNGIDSLFAAIVENCAAYINTGDQIQVGAASYVRGNHCDGHLQSANSSLRGAGDGINAGVSCVISDNVCVDNTQGITTGNNSLIIRNMLSNNSTAFNTGTSTLGPVVTSANIASSNNPHSNYSH